MSDVVRTAWLQRVLRLLAVGLVAAFVPWITLILTRAPLLAPGGALAPILRFQPYNPHYESMLAGIHVVWAVMLWRAAANPARHTLFLDFTMWANGAHGLVMVIATPMQKGLAMTFVEAVPLLGIAAVLWWLRPSPAREVTTPGAVIAESAGSRGQRRAGSISGARAVAPPGGA